jgi:hypothetical protein
MASKQNEPVIGHPKTVAELGQAIYSIVMRDRDLAKEDAENYRAIKAGTATSRPLSDHERRVTAHIQLMMNGSTPQHLLTPAISRSEQIRAERDAIAYVHRDLSRQVDLARYSEAETWVAENDKAWRALCRDIIICATRLFSLEERAREMLKPIEGVCVALPMATTIGRLSLLGIGDPLLDMRVAALNEKIITESDVRKARHVE